MGLDIYMYKLDTTLEKYQELRKLSETIEEEYGELMKPIYEKFDKDYDNPERKRLRNEIVDKLQKKYDITLDEYGGVKFPESCIEIDQSKNPSHINKVGYFRSSYNEGGYNRVAEVKGVPTYYDIFGNEDGEYVFAPKWDEVRERAIEARRLMVEASTAKPFRVCRVSVGFRSEDAMPKSEAEFADMVGREFEKFKNDKSGFYAYSNSYGEFNFGGFAEPGSKTPFGDEIKPSTFVAAAIGLERHFLSEQMIPCAYLALKNDDIGEDDFYVKCIDAIIETCDYVLARPNETFILHWSG